MAQTEEGTDASSFLSEDLECPVCLSLQIDPIALECGHSSCRLCLVRLTRLSASGRACPMCRQPITIKNIFEEAADARLCEAVRMQLGADVYDEQVKERLEELAEINKRANQELPIFAMSPGTRVDGRVALHLFEPRYRILIRRCWEGNHLFVYCGNIPHAGGKGVVVRIQEAIFLPDGRADIVGIGVEEITLGDVWVEENTGGLYHTKVNLLSSAAATDSPQVDAAAMTLQGEDRGSAGRASSTSRCVIM